MSFFSTILDQLKKVLDIIQFCARILLISTCAILLISAFILCTFHIISRSNQTIRKIGSFFKKRRRMIVFLGILLLFLDIIASRSFLEGEFLDILPIMIYSCVLVTIILINTVVNQMNREILRYPKEHARTLFFILTSMLPALFLHSLPMIFFMQMLSYISLMSFWFIFLLTRSCNISLRKKVLWDKILVTRAIFKSEYIVALKMRSLSLPSDNRDARVHENDLASYKYRFFSFFEEKLPLVLHQLDAAISFNVICQKDKFDVYILLKKAFFAVNHDKNAEKVIASANRLMAGISSGVRIKFDMIKGIELNQVIAQLFNQDFDGRKSKKYVTKAKGFFFDGDVTRTAIKLMQTPSCLENNIPPNSFQWTMNNLLRSLMAEEIDASYFFRIKPFGVEFRIPKKPKGSFTNEFENRRKMMISAKFDCGLIINIPGETVNRSKVEKAFGIVQSIWSEKPIKVKNIREFKRKIAPFNLGITLNQVYHFPLPELMHIPTIPSPTQDRILDLSLTLPPERLSKDGRLSIGNYTNNGKVGNPIKINLNALKRHAFICGGTGTGKTTFVKNLMKEINSNYPDIPVLLLEMKGEYMDFSKELPDYKCLEPGIDFGINLFDSEIEPKIHAEKIFDIIKSSFEFLNSSELSPQMEKCLVDLIRETSSMPRREQRNIETFFSIAGEYIERNKHEMPYIQSSWIGIENRLRRMLAGPLKAVFDGPNSNVSMQEILSSKVIINLSSIIKLGGTKNDLYFFSNLLFKHIWDRNLTNGTTLEIKHITVVDDSQYFNKQPVSRNSITTYFEDMSLLLRGTGESLISISTRPDASADVLSNCGLIICFQTKMRHDAEKLQSILNLSDEQVEMLNILPIHEAMVKYDEYPMPFLMKNHLTPNTSEILRQCTNKEHSFPRQRKMGGLMKLKKWLQREGKSHKRTFLDDIFNENRGKVSIKTEFISLLWKYYRDTPRSKKVKDKLIELWETHEILKDLVENASRIHPRLPLLERFSLECVKYGN